MPAIAPRGGDDENDPSRLLWVPARVHPELAPTEFKTFLASRLQSIRRRSGDSFLSVSDDKYGNESDSVNSSSLRRKKSMLSRQIDSSEERTSEGFTDGVERSEKHSLKDNQQDRELNLDELVKDPTKAVRRLAQESHSYSGSLETGMDDMPILPVAPSSGLRRSTRTTYRKGGSLRFGDKASFSKRMAQRQQSGETIETPVASAGDIPWGYPLVRVQSEPTSENVLRPNRPDRRQDRFSQEPLTESTNLDTSSSSRQLQFSVQESSQSSTSTNETQPSDKLSASQDNRYPEKFPQRSSSQGITMTPESGLEPRTDSFGDDSLGHSNQHILPGSVKSDNNSSPSSVKSSVPAITQTGSAVVSPASSGALTGNANRVDTSTTTPVPVRDTRDDKKSDKKSRKDKDDDSHYSTRSGSAWKWLKGVADDRDRKKEESKKSRHKPLSEKAQDNVRLDVIQTSIDKTAIKGRESLVLERESVDKVPDERKKEGSRKSDSKKEKDGSLFSSIFGGGKKREEKEKSKKYQQLLHVPEDIVPYKPLQPDIDYNWSRFPLLEERAIYRMAHIKLANPRRSLHSQVLLSNFMYSYLAIVQAMHPQMNVPVSPQQKRLEEEARRKREEQEYLNHHDAQDEQDEQDENQSLDHSDKPVEYVDDAQIYEDDHTHDNHEDYADDDVGGYSQEVKDYYRYHNDVSDRHGGQDGVW
ncbi:sporulation zds1 [Trichoderma arundinaceum]|uniref:Sporulation zds1 n=1 Tax=Trichoderma arundinaceum TaxID=490622 RepID=A0A395N805_TRIAR|nr:sporulation zds1 [Trichoderma arundinaceum]